MIALPLVLSGADQLRVTCPLAGATLKLRGTVGGPMGMAVTIAALLGPMPLTARTLKVYDKPFVKPVKVWLVLLDAVTHVAPLSLDT